MAVTVRQQDLDRFRTEGWLLLSRDREWFDEPIVRERELDVVSVVANDDRNQPRASCSRRGEYRRSRGAQAPTSTPAVGNDSTRAAPRPVLAPVTTATRTMRRACSAPQVDFRNGPCCL